MALDFEWDPEKAEANRKKHGVSFEQARSVFQDPLARLVDDPEHSVDEERFVLFGQSETGRMLAVMHTEREGTLRLISAREMTPKENRQYAQIRR